MRTCGYTIAPKCIIGNIIEKAFVELDGTFVPCCWMTTDIDRIQELKNFYGDDYSKLNLGNSSIKEIKKQWDKIADSWTSEAPFKTCITECGIKNEN